MKRYAVIFILIFPILFSSCSKKDNTDGKKIFNINVAQGIETLEPVMSSNTNIIWVLNQIAEGLVAFDKNNNIEPLLASHWEISPNGLTYTFHLRQDVLFQDDQCFPDGKGRKVTASDFKYCFERVCNPKTKTRGLWIYRDKVQGAQEYSDYQSGKSASPIPINEVTGFKAVNDSTFQITLIKPFAPFLSLLTMTYGMVYPKEAVELYKDKFGQSMVGTGPFKVVKWDLDKELILEKNPSYWGKDAAGNQLPYLDGAKFTFTQSSETEFLDFQNGRYDFHNPSSETYDQLIDENGNLKDAGSKNYKMVKQPWLSTIFIGMMQSKDFPGGKNSPFVGNKKLRQAMNYAIDRERIIKFVMRSKGTPASNGPIPKGMPGYDSTLKGYTYDRDKAKQLFTEAGYPDGKGLNLTLVIGNEEIQKSIAIAMQEQLKEFGVTIEIEQMLQATLLSKQEDGEFMFWRARWGADYFDPENYLALFYSKNITPNGPNRVAYSNPEIDRLYEQSLAVPDFNERKKIYNEMEKIVIDDAAWLYLYYDQQIYLLANSIEGFYIDGLNIINLKYTKK